MDSCNKPKVFVITPFGEEFLALFEKLQYSFGDQFDFSNAGDMDNQQNILKDIVEGIALAEIIIADLTGLNANVFYELGLAHAMNKKVIIITQDIDDLPFDIKSYRANQYSLQFHKIPVLIEELRKLLHGAIDGQIKYGNPVSDYAPNYQNTDVSFPRGPAFQATSEEAADEIIEEGEKGFLDFIAEIETDLKSATAELTSLAAETREIGGSVSSATDDINRVKAQSGKVEATFVRNLCRKLAEPMESYANKIKLSVTNISSYWSNIENNYLALLDSKFVQNPKDTMNLRDSAKSLLDMQSTILDSNVNVEKLILSLRSNIGMERRLNRAISLNISELESYLTLTNTMSASIDRIVSKTDIVLSGVETQ